MLETLLDETESLLGRVEDETGSRLRLVATERSCLSRASLCGFLYDPENNEVALAYYPKSKSINYAIASGAVRILRFHRAPLEERYLLSSSRQMRFKAYQRMERELDGLPAAAQALSKLGFQLFYDSILTQLASLPVDPHIDRWILDNYPGLRRELEKGLEEEFAKAHKCLGEYAQLITPATVFKAVNAMNAAYAMATDELLGNVRFSRPYEQTPFESLGKQLRSYNVVNRGYRGDRETADEWAKELGLVGWFRWLRLAPTLSKRAFDDRTESR